MNPSQIHTTYKSALHLLSAGKVLLSFEKAGQLVDELQIGDFTDKLNELKQNYNYLLHYFSTDINDPERKTVYNKLISRVFVLISSVREELLLRNSSNFEYTQKRYFPFKRKFSQSERLSDALNYYYTQVEILDQSTDNHQAEYLRLRSNYEQLLQELFMLFWLTTTYEPAEKAFFNRIITEEKWSFADKSLVVSALTLNLWRMFDESKLQLLFDCCNSSDQQVKQRALVGLCFVMARYNKFMPFFPSVRNRLVLLADDAHTVENFRNIIIQIISTTDTDKITRKMQEEILPEVMKISPLLKDKMDKDQLLKSDEWDEENPEWQEIIEKSGVQEKLQELTELQMEGADVYMSTFSMLKSFPFFNELSNWFLPFDAQHTQVNELFASPDKNLLSAFLGNNLMCNSDKYSFCLSVLQMPEMQRNNVKQSFKAESEQMQEMAKDEALLKPDMVSKNISKNYIQDLFRFFRLYPQHRDFSDMFKSALFMHKSYLFDMLSDNSDIKSSIAEYFFTKSHYSEAIELFGELADEQAGSALYFQKIGYACQKVSQVDKALEAFLKADIIQPDDLWTVRKIALCYRIKGEFHKALEYYQHADFIKPDQKATRMNIARCMAGMGNNKEALSIYLKLNAEQEDVRILRSIVWCSFVSNNLASADYHSERLLELEPEAVDFLYAGHIAFCKQQIKNAIDFYRKSKAAFINNKEEFEAAFLSESKTLQNYGVDPNDISLISEVI